MGHPEDSESYEAKTHVEYCRTGYSEVTILGLSSLGSHKEKIAKPNVAVFFRLNMGVSCECALQFWVSCIPSI